MEHYKQKTRFLKCLVIFTFCTSLLCAGRAYCDENTEAETRAEERIRLKAEAAARKQEERIAREKARVEEEALKQAEREQYKKEKAAEKVLRDAEKNKRITEKEKTKVDSYLQRSENYLAEKDYLRARRYAYLAQEISPDREDVVDLIMRIKQDEMFHARATIEEGKREEATSPWNRLKDKKDPMKQYDEGKGWLDYAGEIFEKKTYRLENKEVPEHLYTVDECVRIALRRNQRMILADSQVKLAKMRVWETRRDLFPEVTGKIERSTGKIATAERPRHYQGEKYMVEVKQTVFDGMGTWYAASQSQSNLEVMKLEREKIINEITKETKTAYYSVDKAVKSLELHKDINAEVTELYDYTEGSFQQELIPHVEYLKVKGQKMQSDFQYESSREDLSLAKMILFQAMNMDPDKEISIKPVESPVNTLSIGLENCYQLALVNNPEIKIKEKMIEYYGYDRKMKKARGWPKIEFHGQFGKSAESYQPTEDAKEKHDLAPEWFAGAKGTIPIFGNTFEYNYVREFWATTVSAYKGSESATSYFNLKLLDDLKYFTDLQESRVGFESAKYEYSKAKKDLMVEVKETYFKYRRAILQLDVSKAQVEHQRMYVDVVQEKRRYGEMEVSRVLEEYDKLMEHEYGSVQGEASYFISLVALNKVVGIPDYFRPEYENNEFNQWRAGSLEIQGGTND